MYLKHCCVVDAQGHFKDLVRVLLEDGEIKKSQKHIQGYDLATDERLVDLLDPIGMFAKARLNADETGWVEAATPEEIAVWEKEHPAPSSEPPDPRDLAIAQLMRDVAAIKAGDVRV